MGPARLELATSSLSATRSSQLSYEPKVDPRRVRAELVNRLTRVSRQKKPPTNSRRLLLASCELSEVFELTDLTLSAGYSAISDNHLSFGRLHKEDTTPPNYPGLRGTVM